MLLTVGIGSQGKAVLAQKVMKQMLKPFKPAEPRFEGLNTDVSEETGAVVLLDSAAYLECTVGNRLEVQMEAGPGPILLTSAMMPDG